MSTARQPSTAPGCCVSTCVCEAFEEDKNDVNEGVEDAARVCVCAALAGAIGKEGIVVDRTTYGQ